MIGRCMISVAWMINGVCHMADEEADNRTYIVLINAEEQYSLWPKEKKIPPGWNFVGKEGSKSDCVSYVDSVWTDMRPLSLRKKMDANPG